MPFQWPRAMMETDRRSVSGYLPGVMSFTCWLARDSLAERLCAEIDELAGDNAGAMDAATRGFRENELLTQILSVERVEAEAIWAADHDGVQIPFRSDANICAVLGLV